MTARRLCGDGLRAYINPNLYAEVTYDSLEYLYGVLRDLGIKKIICVSGCSLQTHLVNAKTDNAAYLYYTNTDGSWSSTDGYKMSDAIASENWDFISFQQASHESGVASSYVHLPKLIDIVEEICPTAHFV